MKISENISASTKATSGRPAYSPAPYQVKSAKNLSFRCRVKIREDQEAHARKLISGEFCIIWVSIGLNRNYLAFGQIDWNNLPREQKITWNNYLPSGQTPTLPTHSLFRQTTR